MSRPDKVIVFLGRTLSGHHHDYTMLKRIFPEDFGERRIISESYLNFCSICSHYKIGLYWSFSLDTKLLICYSRSHYVHRYLSPHPWWQNVYAASAARVVSRQRQGAPSYHCECQSLFRGRDRSHATCPTAQGGAGAPWHHPGRDHVETRNVVWCGVDRVPHRSTFGDRKSAGHDTRRETGAVASDGPRH